MTGSSKLARHPLWKHKTLWIDCWEGKGIERERGGEHWIEMGSLHMLLRVRY